MEDDDEFGDLYTDVLRPFSSSEPPATAAAAPPRPIDVNDDDEILYGGSRRDPPSLVNQTLADSSSRKNVTIAPVNDLGGEARVLGSIDVKLGKKETGGSDLVGFQPGEVDEDVKFDIDEGNDEGIGDNNGPIIPGLGVDFNSSARNDDVRGDGGGGDGGGGGDEDWEEDSDSEDDLQILLNDTNNLGMERGGMGGEEYDDEEDGDPLVIVADGDPNQGMEDQNWGGGEDSSAAAGAGGLEGERKEGDTVGKGGGVVGPKIGYSNHVYHHPFHSQFKYVRPGAAPIPGGNAVGPGGTPSQVRPPITIGPMVGRGRGDWRPVGMKNVPSMQKGFHPGYGTPALGSGRGFGVGLEFTLPSHKTIFEVDIDSFEEKPWKYPGVELSDFFNFDLNEESWKAYCRQLEQLRLETTMQSKIRVYESGRAENEFDPDLPPELAAAAGGHEVQPDNSNIGKPHGAQNDLTKGSAPMRPPLPPGKAIQVETGYGERLPSIDTRPPRMRDNDVIIEIPLLDSQDDSSTGNDHPDGDGDGDGNGDVDPSHSHVVEDDTTAMETEHGNDFPQAYNSQKGVVPPLTKSVSHDIPEGGRMQSFNHVASAQYSPGSRMQPQRSPDMDTGSDYERRRTRHKKSPHLTPTRTARDKRFHDRGEEESIESMDGKHSSPSSHPVMVRTGKEWSNEGNSSAAVNDSVPAEGSLQPEKDEHELATSVSHKEENMHRTTKKQKLMSHSEQTKTRDLDDGEDSKAARSSENSKARSGSSKDYQKRRDGAEDEVVQDRRSRRGGSVKRNLDENEQNFQTRDRDGRHMERNYSVMKGREDSHPHMDIDSSGGHHPHLRNESFDRRKERDPNGALERRDGDPLGRKSRDEDTRKRERGDEMGYRPRSKNRDSERSDKDELVPSRKHLESGSYKAHYDKDGASRHRERDEKRSKYGVNDEYQSKRRKDEEYMRRDVVEKEEVLHGHRETTNRRRRERDEMLDPRKKDDQLRVRDNLDDYYQARQKDQVWPQRERGERQREREEFYRLKQSYEELPSTREREDGRGSLRTARAVDDKSLLGHARMKDEYRGSDKEYPGKDSVRTGEQQRRRDRMEDEVFSHHRGHEDPYARGYQLQSEDRRSRKERSSTRFDKAVDASDTQKLQEKKYKETTRKIRESEGGEHNISAHSRRSEDQIGRVDDTGLKGKSEVRNGGIEIPAQRNSSVKHKEDASSDDEQQDSRRGRSKLERWTSHKERDYNIGSKSSRYKDIDKNADQGAVESSKLHDEPAKVTEAAEKHSLGKETAPVENKRTDKKPLDDKHLDTVEKLKKRSERFKLPLPIEKDASTIKKMETEALPTVNPESNKDSEVKPERPARKRRWTGS